jgi:hypothetical protein
MKAKIAYLTSPAPNIYLLNFQIEQGIDLSVEISEGHLANIVIDGASFALRKQYPSRVPEIAGTRQVG